MFNQFVSPLTQAWIVESSIFSLWRIVASLIILLLGVIVARAATRWLRRMTRRATSAPAVKDSPLSVVWETTEGLKGTGVITTVVFWTVMLFFVAWAGELLGVRFLSDFVTLVLRAVPHLVSALIILVLGLMLAGVGERVIKQQAKRFAPQQAVLIGTFFSYGIMVLFGLIAVSELGIASDFIRILFAGCVFALSLAVGLALGLGSKELVAESLRSMSQDERVRRAVMSRSSDEPSQKKSTRQVE